MKYASSRLSHNTPMNSEFSVKYLLNFTMCILSGLTFSCVLNGTILAEEAEISYSADRLFFGKQQTYENGEENTASNSVEQGVVLLDFYNDACGPCRSMMPAVDSLVRRGFRVSKVNTDRFPDWANRFHITKIPCFVVIVNGKEVSRHVGVTSESKLENLIVQAGGSPVQPQPVEMNASPRTQIAESAWRGRETKLSVQEIVAGNFVFENENQALVTAPTEARTGINAAPQTLASSNIPVKPIPTETAFSSNSGQEIQRVSAEAELNWKAQGETRPSSEVVSPGSFVPASVPSQVLSSTVRIHVNDAQSEGCGTGTLIDCRSGHALVLTCGHLFHEYKKGDSIQVEIFTNHGILTLPGRYVNHDEERDLGLISLTINQPITISSIAGPNFQLQRGMPVTTAGCSQGAVPTLEAGRITNLNRFLGTPNIEVSAVPVQGRSGGGLFTQSGKLIGVCFAANPDDQEGIYTSLEAIHEYFRVLKMEQFVLSPRNESQPGQSTEPVELALNELPASAQTTATPGLKQAEPMVVSLANSDTVEPINPAPQRLTTVSREKSLTGSESPEWPPKWKE